MGKNLNCRMCGKEINNCILDLGVTPIANRMVEERNLEREEKYYPLRICRCPECKLVQLMDDVNPTEIFTEYPYFSSFSGGWLNHAKQYVEKIKKIIPSDATVVEIASNDGYLLQNFLGGHYEIYGIEPSKNVAQVAIEKGINTITEFFSTEFAKKMVADNKNADLMQI